MVIRKGKINWIRLTRPNQKELDALQKQFDIHPIIVDELKDVSARSKIEIYKDYSYAVLHLPIYDTKEHVSRRGEIDFIVTKKTLITIQYEELEPIDLIEKRLEQNDIYKDRLLGETTAKLLYYIIESCLLFTLRQLRHIDEKIEYVRNTIFSEQEKDILEKISYVKRDLLSYRLIIKSQGVLFNSLQKYGMDFFGKESSILFSDLEGDYLKIERQTENYKETIEAFENTNTQLLTVRMTKVMQRFSVLAFLTFPIMVFLSLLTVETSSRPTLGFWTVAGIVIVATIGMVIIFRKKGWL